MLIKITNPLIAHYVGKMRDKETGSKDFGQVIKNLVYLMAGEVFKDFEAHEKVVTTPICDTTILELSDKICLIPVMRAGLSMLQPMQDILPDSTCGFLGMKRKYAGPDNAVAELYYSNLPKNLPDYNVYLLEVVMASGATLVPAIQHLTELGVKPQNINIISFIASDVSIGKVEKIDKDIKVFACEIDHLRESDGYLVPGLGDAGDRYCNHD